MKRKKQIDASDLPSVTQLKTELNREKYKRRYMRILKSTVYSLIVVAAAAVLVATLWMPVLQIYGTSMAPTLDEGEIVLSVKSNRFETGDLVAFYIGNKLLVKRVIAGPGDWFNMDEDGNVFINGEAIDEPYVTDKAFGECNLELPYQVPENRWFLMGDHRSSSVDSRNTAVGCIDIEQIVGKIVFRVWPFDRFGETD
ncbi:MAG: signal peptidase I [Clostridia bacterium]|nr:signal peptidase I [Clostridia bacterium]MBR6780270.1 signal peptidase I [Clostridia bacterium]